MQNIILLIHMLVAVCIIVLVLLQHGKGADAGAGFGSGASGTVFGARGSTPFLMKLTSFLALIFFLTSISLAYRAAHIDVKKAADSQVDSILGTAKAPIIHQAPASKAPVFRSLQPKTSKKPAANKKSAASKKQVTKNKK